MATTTKSSAKKASADTTEGADTSAAQTPATYEPGKFYAVTLARAVEHEGFVFKPTVEPMRMSGEFASAVAGDIVEAKELPPAPDHPEAPPSVHETAAT